VLVAKTRSRSKKSASSSPAKKKTRKPKKPAPKPKQVELSGVRKKLRDHVAMLNAVEQPSDKVRDTVARLNRMLDEIDGACGPNMIVPLE